jgi:hypothetical protein
MTGRDPMVAGRGSGKQRKPGAGRERLRSKLSISSVVRRFVRGFGDRRAHALDITWQIVEGMGCDG